MSRRGFFERVDDWLNPIVVKELRQAVQSRLIVSGLLLFLFLQVLVLGFVLLDASSSNRAGGLNTRMGRQLFEVLQGFMLGTCLLVSLYVGGRLAGERSDTHTDLLFITTLAPRAIVSGKFLSGLVLVLLSCSACTPFMTFTYLLRGIDIPSILIVLGIDLVLAMWGIAVTIFLGVIPAPRAVKGLLGVQALMLLGYLYVWGMELTRMQMSGRLFASAADFWTRVALIGGLVLASMGLLFSWSVAILAPPASNKSLLLRLYVLGVVVVFGVGGYLVGEKYTTRRFLCAWVLVAAVLGSVQLFISINEREQSSHRVMRAIPRSLLLRPLAFLLYSGAAGGVLFSVLLIAGSIGLTILAVIVQGGFAWSSGVSWGSVVMRGGYEEVTNNARLAVLLALYTYCFSLSAVFVRTVVLRNQVRHNFTWLLVLVLVGLGSMGPYLYTILTAPDMIYRESGNPSLLWSNPFYTIDVSMRRSWGDEVVAEGGWSWAFSAECLPFLLVWATLVTLATLPWLIRQVRAFHPPARSNGASRES